MRAEENLFTGISSLLRISPVRSLRSESAPKTSAAARVVRLTARNVEVLKQVIELRAQPNDYVFKNSLGHPIDQRSFYKIFCGLQRVLGIRLRDLYATKDTYASSSASAWLA